MTRVLGWPAALLTPYIERRVNELICGAATPVALEQNGAVQRPERSKRAIQRAIGAPANVRRD